MHVLHTLDEFMHYFISFLSSSLVIVCILFSFIFEYITIDYFPSCFILFTFFLFHPKHILTYSTLHFLCWIWLLFFCFYVHQFSSKDFSGGKREDLCQFILKVYTSQFPVQVYYTLETLTKRSPPIRFPNLNQFSGEKRVYYGLLQEPTDIPVTRTVYKPATEVTPPHLLMACRLVFLGPNNI